MGSRGETRVWRARRDLNPGSPAPEAGVWRLLSRDNTLYWDRSDRSLYPFPRRGGRLAFILVERVSRRVRE